MTDASIRLLVRYQTATAKLRDERGAAMAEYGLLLALIAVVAIGAISIFGDSIGETFDKANTELQDGLSDANADSP